MGTIAQDQIEFRVSGEAVFPIDVKDAEALFGEAPMAGRAWDPYLLKAVPLQKTFGRDEPQVNCWQQNVVAVLAQCGETRLCAARMSKNTT